jgi:glutaredoxin
VLRVLCLLLGWACAALAAGAGSPATEAGAEPDIEVFTRAGCAHCEEAERFLDRLSRERPHLVIVRRDVREDPGARDRLRALAAERGIPTPGVPAFHVRGELVVGFAGAGTTGANIRSLLESGRPARGAGAAPAESCSIEESAACGPQAPAARLPPAAAVELPVLGVRLSLQEAGLPLFTFVLGLLDGFNPCSMWVLIFMLSMLASLGSRRKMLLIAGVFVAVEGVAYFAFMAAWLNLFLLIGISRASEIALAIVAGAAGAINVKDFFAFGRGVSLSIPQSAKPGIYARVRGILQAENLTAALIGTVVLAVLVQVIEFMCTSGFPALYTRILTLRKLPGWEYYGYLLLYNVAYMLDDVIVLGIGVVTLSIRKLQEREGRWLKLGSGVVMLGLAVYLLAAPLLG